MKGGVTNINWTTLNNLLNFSTDYELVINVKDFPDIKEGDVVEIYHPDDEYK